MVPDNPSSMSLDDCFRIAIADKNPGISYDWLQWANISRFPENWKFNAFHLHLLSWVLANPLFLVLGWNTASLLLVQHGWTINSSIHNVRNFYEFELNNTHKRINEVLQTNLSKEDKRRALGELKATQANLAKLVERSTRMYYWNPMEAHAKAMVGQIAPQIMGQYQKEEEQNGKTN